MSSVKFNFEVVPKGFPGTASGVPAGLARGSSATAFDLG
jgi:hypothetical protein